MSRRDFVTEHGEAVAVVQEGDYTRIMEGGMFTGCFWLTDAEHKQIKKATSYEEIKDVLHGAERSKIYD